MFSRYLFQLAEEERQAVLRKQAQMRAHGQVHTFQIFLLENISSQWKGSHFSNIFVRKYFQLMERFTLFKYFCKKTFPAHGEVHTFQIFLQLFLLNTIFQAMESFPHFNIFPNIFLPTKYSRYWIDFHFKKLA